MEFFSRRKDKDNHFLFLDCPRFAAQRVRLPSNIIVPFVQHTCFHKLKGNVFFIFIVEWTDLSDEENCFFYFEHKYIV